MIGLLCAAFGHANVTGADFDKGYRALYLSAALPQNPDAEGVVLPEVGNAANLAVLVETTPGSNIYTGNCSWGTKKFYIYTKLVEDGTFVPGENCIGIATEKVFNNDDNFMVKLSLAEGPQSYPFNFEGIGGMSWSSARLLVDLNEMEVYVEPRQSLWYMIKGQEDDLSYKKYETLTPISGYAGNLHNSFTAGQEFRIHNSLIPYSKYYDYNEIGTVSYAPYGDRTVELDDNGIGYVAERVKYDENFDYTKLGWWKITKTGDYIINYATTYNSDTQEDLRVMKFVEVGSVKELYISTNGSNDLTDSDNIFNWQTYQVPAATEQAGWAQKLLPVEGRPGVLAGEVNFAYMPDWSILGAMCFDTFRTDENADYVNLSIYCSDLNVSNDLCDVFYHPSLNGYTSRISVYYNGISAPVKARLVVNLNEGTVEAEIEPENYEAIVPLNQSQVLYLVGKPSGWNIQNVSEEWQLGADAAGVYVRTFFIPVGDFMLRFYTSLGDWNNGSIGCQYDDEPVTCEFNSAGVYEGNCCMGKGSWNFPSWDGGYVTIEVDIEGRHVKFKSTDGIPDGEPVPGAETLLVDLYDNVTLTGDFGEYALVNSDKNVYQYSGLVEIPAGAHTFGIVADGISIGAWKDGRIVPLEPNAYFYQRYYLDNENLWSTAEDWAGGIVEVSISLLTHNVWFSVPTARPLSYFPEDIEIIGDFTNGWNPVTPLTLNNLGNGIYEGTFDMPADCGEFKFRELDNWMENVGSLFTQYNTFFTEAATHTLQGSNLGGNFKVSDKFTGGDVKFRIDLNDMTVTASTEAFNGLKVPTQKAGAIHAGLGMIVVEGMAGTAVRVCDLSGRLVLSVTPASDRAYYTLAPGFYIANGQKIIVK